MKINILVVLALAGILVVSGCVSDKEIDNEQKSSQSDGADSDDAGSSSSGSSGSSGTGNTGVVSENDSAPIKGVRFVTPAITNQDVYKEIWMKPNSGQILEGTVSISIYKNDIGKLSINNVRGKTLKDFRVKQTSTTTVIHANISNPLKNEISFSGELIIRPILSPEMSVGRATETVTTNGEAIILRFPNEEWEKGNVLLLSISI